jgi:hypothetical protein
LVKGDGSLAHDRRDAEHGDDEDGDGASLTARKPAKKRTIMPPRTKTRTPRNARNAR